MKYMAGLGALALGALALFPARAEPTPQCSRNSDDIKSAVVIQKENGEFCAVGEAEHKEMQGKLAAIHVKTDAPLPQGVEMTRLAGVQKRVTALAWAPEYALQVQMLEVAGLHCAFNNRPECAGGANAIISSITEEFYRSARCVKMADSYHTCDAEMQAGLNQKRSELVNSYMNGCTKNVTISVCEKYLANIVDEVIANF
jgi:hypothetical protein